MKAHPNQFSRELGCSLVSYDGSRPETLSRIAQTIAAFCKNETSLERQKHFYQFQETTDSLPCHIHLLVCLWIMDPHSRAAKKNTSHGNEVLRPWYQWGSLCHTIRPHKDLLPMAKRRKLQWYGHVSRSSGLAKTILQGTVKGERRQGRQKKRWEDTAKELTGLGFVKSQRAVEKRETWRKLLVKSSLVLRRPLR